MKELTKSTLIICITVIIIFFGNEYFKQKKENNEKILLNSKNQATLEIKVDKKGIIKDIKIIKTSGNIEKDKKIIEKVKKYKFEPSIKNGKPIESTYKITTGE